MKFTFVDAFCGPEFLGNQAAVAIAESFDCDEAMAKIAVDLAMPATVFVRPLAESEYHIRWYTPIESDFCGHGTLAATHVLYESGKVAPAETVHFRSKAGPLSARKDADWLTLNLPALALHPRPHSLELEQALSAKVVGVHDASGRILVELADENTVHALRPDVASLRAMFGQAVIVTAPAQSPYDFVSRYFRKQGDAEDPVTGSAHCALTPFWSARLQKKEMLAYQASKRGGVLGVKCQGDRVLVSGRAKTSTASHPQAI